MIVLMACQHEGAEKPEGPSFSYPITDGYAIIHYRRADGAYGDPSAANSYWGLHLEGEAIAQSVSWNSPTPFLGNDEYGRFAFIGLRDASKKVKFSVYKGNSTDGTGTRSFSPSDHREIWVKQGSSSIYYGSAAALGSVSIHYRRPGGDYSGWGLHVWQGTTEFTTWTSPLALASSDDYGAVYTVDTSLFPTLDLAQPISFVIHNGDTKDTDDDRTVDPLVGSSAWIKQGDAVCYGSRPAAEGFAVLHYRRPDGDYGDYSSDDFRNYWGLHTWGGAPNPGWETPYKKSGYDDFGVYFKIPFNSSATNFGYSLHRGEEKDPSIDQVFYLTKYHEAWRLSGTDPDKPYIVPVPD